MGDIGRHNPRHPKVRIENDQGDDADRADADRRDGDQHAENSSEEHDHQGSPSLVELAKSAAMELDDRGPEYQRAGGYQQCDAQHKRDHAPRSAALSIDDRTVSVAMVAGTLPAASRRTIRQSALRARPCTTVPQVLVAAA